MRNIANNLMIIILGSGLFRLAVLGVFIDTAFDFTIWKIHQTVQMLPLPPHDYHGELIGMIDAHRGDDQRNRRKIARFYLAFYCASLHS